MNLNKMSRQTQDVFWDLTLEDCILIKYLDDNINRPIKKQEMRENIVRLGQFKQKGNRPFGLKTLNKKLEKYHYKIDSVKDWNRKSENYAKTFWEIHRT